MSLLDRSPSFEDILVFPQEEVTDIDGNPRTRPATTGIPAKARFQFEGQSGTASRDEERQDEGFNTEKFYIMRFSRKSQLALGVLGSQSEIEWKGARWAIYGDARYYTGSPKTAHVEYVVKRS